MWQAPVSNIIFAGKSESREVNYFFYRLIALPANISAFTFDKILFKIKKRSGKNPTLPVFKNSFPVTDIPN